MRDHLKSFGMQPFQRQLEQQGVLEDAARQRDGLRHIPVVACEIDDQIGDGAVEPRPDHCGGHTVTLVADGDDGWEFLEAAARTFFRSAGGNVFGWTSKGLGMPSIIPFIGGHTEHLWCDIRGVVITPADDGGAYLSRWES